MGGSAIIDDDWELTSPLVKSLVLAGGTGSGKSATGNSIIGRKAFKSMSSPAGVTSTCEIRATVLDDGHILNVIDTPGLFDCNVDFEYIGKEIVKCMTMAKDGIHAILIVLSVRSRFSVEGSNVVESLRTLFGPKINDYMILVFTGGDDLEDNEETLDDYLGRDCPNALKETLLMCGNRRIMFDNKTKDAGKKSEQMKNLLILVNEVVSRNGGRPYTDELFVELKKGELKLHNGTAEVDSREGCSNHEISELKDNVYKSYEEQYSKITEMVESRVREEAHRLEHQFEQQLAVEQAARREGEEMAQAAHVKSNDEIVSRVKEETHRLEQQLAAGQAVQVKSNDEIEKLRGSLEKAHREVEELRKPNDVIKKLRETFEKAHREVEELPNDVIKKLRETFEKAHRETERCTIL